jgi:flavin-binding protein dodecin
MESPIRQRKSQAPLHRLCHLGQQKDIGISNEETSTEHTLGSARMILESSKSKQLAFNIEELTMSVAKVVEISCQSSEGFEDEIREGIRRTARTVDAVQTAWVKEMQVDVKGGEVIGYRVNLKVTFLLNT